MRKTGFIVVLILWLAAIAFIVLFVDKQCEGQQQLNVYQQAGPNMSGHPQTATVHELNTGGGLTTEHGYRPASDFPQTKTEPSLGDVARANRVDHANVPKAKFTFEGYGQPQVTKSCLR